MSSSMDDDYAKKLDSLGSYFNSQQVAHVGYLLVIAAFILQLLLLFFTKELSFTSPYYLSIPAVVFIILFFCFFFYFIARTQLYSVYSQILWELRGITGNSTKKIVSSSVNLNRVSLLELIQFIMYVRLFASQKRWSEYSNKIGHEKSACIRPRKLDDLKAELTKPKGVGYGNRRLFRLPLWFLLPIALFFTGKQVGPDNGTYFVVTGWRLLFNIKRIIPPNNQKTP